MATGAFAAVRRYFFFELGDLCFDLRPQSLVSFVLGYRCKEFLVSLKLLPWVLGYLGCLPFCLSFSCEVCGQRLSQVWYKVSVEKEWCRGRIYVLFRSFSYDSRREPIADSLPVTRRQDDDDGDDIQ